MSDNKCLQYLAFIDAEVDGALRLSQDLGYIKWQPQKPREGLVVSRANVEGRNHTAVRGKCLVNASFDEMLHLLKTTTTEAFQHLEKLVQPHEFLDGRVLHVLRPGTSSLSGKGSGFACIKWHAIKSASLATSPHRDYVYVEVVDEFLNETGQRVGYRLAKSVTLREFLDFESKYDLIRAKAFMLTTFTSVVSPQSSSSSKHHHHHRVELTTMNIEDLGAEVPAWLVAKMTDLASLRSLNFRTAVDGLRLGRLRFPSPDAFPDEKSISQCRVCTKGFSFVRNKYRCRSCGDVCCSTCASIADIFGVDARRGKARVCLPCHLRSRSLSLLPTLNKHFANKHDANVDDARSSTSSTISSSRSSVFTDSGSSTESLNRNSSPTTTTSHNMAEDGEAAAAARHTVTLLGTKNFNALRMSGVNRKSGVIPRVVDLGLGRKTKIPPPPPPAAVPENAPEVPAQNIDSMFADDELMSQIAKISIEIAAIDTTITSNLQKSMSGDFDDLPDEEPEMSDMDMLAKLMGDLAEEPVPEPALAPAPTPAQEPAQPVVGKPESPHEKARSPNPALPGSPSDKAEIPIVSVRTISPVATVKKKVESQPVLESPGETQLSEAKTPRLGDAKSVESFSSYLRDSDFHHDVHGDDSDLPEGWICIQPKTTGKVYYYNQELEITQWTRPEEEAGKQEDYQVL